VNLSGPVDIETEVCGVKLIHPFFIFEGETPIVAGFDLITAAKLVIDASAEEVWSHYTTNQPSKNLENKRSACQSALTVTENMTPESEPSPPTNSPQIHMPTCTPFLNANRISGPNTNNDDINSAPVQYAENTVDTDETAVKNFNNSMHCNDSKLPKHVQVLYLNTVENTNLTNRIAKCTI